MDVVDSLRKPPLPNQIQASVGWDYYVVLFCCMIKNVNKNCSISARKTGTAGSFEADCLDSVFDAASTS